MPPAAELLAVGNPADAQLELLFAATAAPGTATTGESRENGPGNAPQGKAPPGAAGRAERAGAHESGAIPARCPVVGEPVCYRADCRWYQGAGCAHPEATAKPQRRRRAKK